MQKPDTAGFSWNSDIISEFEGAWLNGRVGSQLVSQNDKVRVWHLSLAPGERIGFHMHVLNYFWTALGPGRSRSYMQDGSVVEAAYDAGTTKHFEFGKGEYMIHDLQNVGETDLQFVTVEHLNSPNTPLAV